MCTGNENSIFSRVKFQLLDNTIVLLLSNLFKPVNYVVFTLTLIFHRIFNFGITHFVQNCHAVVGHVTTKSSLLLLFFLPGIGTCRSGCNNTSGLDFGILCASYTAKRGVFHSSLSILNCTIFKRFNEIYCSPPSYGIEAVAVILHAVCFWVISVQMSAEQMTNS